MVITKMTRLEADKLGIENLPQMSIPLHMQRARIVDQFGHNRVFSVVHFLLLHCNTTLAGQVVTTIQYVTMRHTASSQM